MTYLSTFKILGKILIPTTLMIILIIIIKVIVPYENPSRLYALIYGGILSLIGGVAYIYTCYKMDILNSIFGKEYIIKLVKKLTFGKVSIN